MTDLLPCPLCSSPAWFCADDVTGNSVRCTSCGLRLFGHAGHREALTAAWNIRARSAMPAGSWVSVLTSMPATNISVLVCCMETTDHEGPFVASGFWIEKERKWKSQDSSVFEDKPIPWPVTHWMPIPQPPTSEGEVVR